ncbi:MAG: MmcQ/YjbR family DNA-binding protein [Clostridia bacterium]|nr:MmcQ/YjbR family DNA-binding protein [Clostridia bacterium]
MAEPLENIQYTEILDYCLQKNGAFVDYPFGADYITVKIKNSHKSVIFAEIFVLDGELKLTFSTDEVTAQYLRSAYPQVIVRGWHCPPVQAKYKSTLSVNGVSNETLLQVIDISYERAVSKLK